MILTLHPGSDLLIYKCTQSAHKCTNSMQAYNNHLGTPLPTCQICKLLTDLHKSPQISQAAKHSQAACIQDVLALVVEATRLGEEERSWMV